jgi:hypothetical protein
VGRGGGGDLGNARLVDCIHVEHAQQVPHGPLMVDLYACLIRHLAPANLDSATHNHKLPSVQSNGTCNISDQLRL